MPVHKVLVGIHLPDLCAGRVHAFHQYQEGAEPPPMGAVSPCRRVAASVFHHSFTSTCTVLTPLITASPALISSSAIFALRVCSAAGDAPRISASDGGGSGKSSPSSWKLGSGRHTRTYAFVFVRSLFTVATNSSAVCGVLPRIWRT